MLAYLDALRSRRVLKQFPKGVDEALIGESTEVSLELIDGVGGTTRTPSFPR
jgi:hypothetical protein